MKNNSRANLVTFVVSDLILGVEAVERNACDLSTVSTQKHNFENYKSYIHFKRVGLRLN